MPIPDPNTEAPFGSLDATIHRHLILARRFADARDRALIGLLGDAIRHSPLRLELARAVLIEFGYDRHARVGHYVDQCAHIASSFGVRDEINRMAAMGLIITRKQTGDQRVTLVVPTNRLVGGISKASVKLSAKVERFFISRGEQKE